jgi:cytochrome P450
VNAESPTELRPAPAERGCPVVDWDISEPRPVLTYFDELNTLREQSPIVWNTTANGFWMLLSQETVREAFQTPEIFCSDATIVTAPEPDWHWIPTMENPPQHTLYRHVLNPGFSPRAAKSMEPEVRRAAVEIIEELYPKGGCDFVTEFATVFSTRVFLTLLGLPEADTQNFVDWVEAIFAGFGGGAEAMAKMATAQTEVHEYFVDLLSQRKSAPLGPDDFFTALLDSTVGDRPITDEEFVNIADVLVLAGLDTVKSQLGYCMFHLAEHEEQRHRLATEPAVIPGAVEEFLRAFSIVMDGRQIKEDTVFHGCPMKKGDMVMLTIPAASRDPREFDSPDTVDFDRRVNRHVAFAAGPHRCLGAHIARLELAVALEEWHRRIPDYRMVDADQLVETGPQLGLDSLRLTWDITR